MNLKGIFAILASSVSAGQAHIPEERAQKEFAEVDTSGLHGRELQDQDIYDVCEAADPIEVNTVTPGSTIDGPSFPSGDFFCGTSIESNLKWYQVIGTGNVLTASTCNDWDASTGSAAFDTKISIFCACAIEACVTGLDDISGCSNSSTKLSWDSNAGQTYYIMVHGYFATGLFNLAILDDGVMAEPNDVCDFNPASDVDGDGVLDNDDMCPGTEIPETNVPELELKPNHFALTQFGILEFEKGEPKNENGQGYPKSYSTEDTFGCSCEQIIEQLGLGNGLRRFGCSPGIMECWIHRQSDPNFICDDEN